MCQRDGITYVRKINRAKALIDVLNDLLFKASEKIRSRSEYTRRNKHAIIELCYKYGFIGSARVK